MEPVDPARAGVACIVRDHIWFYVRDREKVADYARRWNCTPEEALVYVIVDDLFDNFDLKLKA
jgi:hypothetical protein